MTITATVKDGRGRTRTNKKVMGGPCIFPFKYKKETHDACIEDDGDQICATEINPKTGTMTKYGYCPTEPPPVRKRVRKRALRKKHHTRKPRERSESRGGWRRDADKKELL